MPRIWTYSEAAGAYDRQEPPDDGRDDGHCESCGCPLAVEEWGLCSECAESLKGGE